MKKKFILSGLLFYFLSAFPVSAFTATNEIMNEDGVNTYADAVYLDVNGTFVDYSSYAENTTENDVYLPNDNTTLYIGSRYVFDTVLFYINKAGDTSGPGGKNFKMEYYNDDKAEWATLDFTDGTSNFGSTGYKDISFDIPDRWDDSVYSKASVNGSKYYWVRISAKSLVTVNSAAEAGQVALRAYNFMLIAESERGVDLDETLTKPEFSLTGGTDNTIEGFRNIGDGNYQLALDNNWADTKYNLTVSPSKYVAESISTDEMSSLSSKESETMDFQYSHIIQVKNSSGTYIVPSLVTVGTVTCEIGAVFAYCPLTTSEDGTSGNPESYTVYASGYTTKTGELSDERSSTNDEQVVTSVTLTSSGSSGGSGGSAPDGYSYLHVTIQNEDNKALEDMDEDNFVISGGSDDEIYGFTNNNNGEYILTLNGSASDTSYSVKVLNDGYVAVTFDTGELDEASSYKTLEMKFAYKVKVENSSGTDISTATVKAGDDYDVTCYYISSGNYGCAVPLSDSSVKYKVRASGYETYYGEFSSDRNQHTDDQRTSAAELDKDSDSCSHPFDDLDDHWAEGEIEDLYCRGVVDGRDYDTFAPDDTITRAEFLKIALLNAGYDVSGASGEDFYDVNSGDWFYEYVSLAQDHDFISGYSDGTYKPNEAINRAEALVILLRIAGQTLYGFDDGDIDFSDVSVSDWFAYAVVIGDNDGIVGGYSDGTFRPGNSVTRAEVAVMATRVYDAYYSGN